MALLSWRQLSISQKIPPQRIHSPSFFSLSSGHTFSLQNPQPNQAPHLTVIKTGRQKKNPRATRSLSARPISPYTPALQISPDFFPPPHLAAILMRARSIKSAAGAIARGGARRPGKSVSSRARAENRSPFQAFSSSRVSFLPTTRSPRCCWWFFSPGKLHARFMRSRRCAVVWIRRE